MNEQETLRAENNRYALRVTELEKTVRELKDSIRGSIENENTLRAKLEQARRDIFEIQLQHHQEADEWKTDEEVTAERDTLRSENERLKAECARLRDGLNTVLASAHPHPRDNPAMALAWRIGKDALAPTDASKDEEVEG